MSLLNELIAKVSALTSTVNQLTTNSKAIQELPAQETLNPDSLIHVSKDNTSKKITVQQIINAAISNQNDQIISIGTITLSGNDLIISDISAKINNVIQSISLPTIVNIPFCASGLKRIDLLVYNTSNEITRIAGTETSGAIVIAPTLPINSLLITQISVTDSVISEPQPPILGTNFLQKEFEQSQIVNATGSDVVIALNIKGRNNIILNGALTGVIGFSLTNLDLNPAYAEYPHEGKDYFIQNKTGHSVMLKNADSTVDIGFLSKDGNDILLPNNGIVFFKKSLNILQEIFRSFQDFTPENVANKSFDIETDKTSNIKYPTVRSVYTWVLNTFATRDWVISQGFITNVINALGFTPENVANKSFDIETDKTSNIKYPTVKSVFNWAVATFRTSAQVESQITTALAGYATQYYVNSQGFITNVITALGFTPENENNKSTFVDSSSDIKYPTTKAVFNYALSKAFPRYSFKANNTNTDNAPAQDFWFQQSGKQAYTGSVTWSGTTSPSGTTNHSFNWIRIGNMVTLNITLVYQTPGVANTNAVIPLLSSMPVPIIPDGLGASLRYIYPAYGKMSLNEASITTASSEAALRVNVGFDGYELVVGQASTSAKVIKITCQYFCE